MRHHENIFDQQNFWIPSFTFGAKKIGYELLPFSSLLPNVQIILGEIAFSIG